MSDCRFGVLVSDCRFGVSPVKYPDPDPDLRWSKTGMIHTTERVLFQSWAVRSAVIF